MWVGWLTGPLEDVTCERLRTRSSVGVESQLLPTMNLDCVAARAWCVPLCGFIQFRYISDGIVASIVEPQRLSSVKKVAQHTCGCRRLTAPPCPATEEAGLGLCVWVGARRTEPWNIHSRRAMAGQWKRLWILWHT